MKKILLGTTALVAAAAIAAKTEKPADQYDHKYEPGAFGVCKRCGQQQHPNP